MVVLYIPCFTASYVMLHIFAQVYFIFSQCTYHVLKHCVVLWLNTNTKKNLLERMQTGFVIRSHMGRKASTDIPAFIFLLSDHPKPRNTRTNLRFTITELLLFSCAMTLCHERWFSFCGNQCQTTSQASIMTECFPFTWDHEDLTPSTWDLVKRNTLTHKIYQLQLL